MERNEMTRNTNEDKIIDIIKKASYTSFDAYRHSMYASSSINNMHLDAGRTRNKLVEASLYAAEAKKEIENLINSYQGELDYLELNISLLTDKVIIKMAKKSKKLLELENMNVDIHKAGNEYDNYIDLTEIDCFINTNKITFKKNSRFGNTFSELNKTITYCNSASRTCNNARYSTNNEEVKRKMSLSNSDARCASRHADFAVGTFKEDLKVTKKNIMIYRDMLQGLYQSLNILDLEDNAINEIISYNVNKIVIMDSKEELQKMKLELSNICKKAGTPLYTDEEKNRARVLRKEIDMLEIKEKHITTRRK